MDEPLKRSAARRTILALASAGFGAKDIDAGTLFILE